MTLFDILRAVAIASLWMIGGTCFLIAWTMAWAWLTKRDPAEFWEARDRRAEEYARANVQYNTRRESHLRMVSGGDFGKADWEALERGFALDADQKPAA